MKENVLKSECRMFREKRLSCLTDRMIVFQRNIWTPPRIFLNGFVAETTPPSFSHTRHFFKIAKL